MKHTLILLIAVINFSISTWAQIDNNINSVSLGMILIEQPSVDEMIKICKYYKLLEEPSQKDYIMFRHPNGTVFQFKVDELNSRYFPIVKISTKDSQKNIDNILITSGYKKEVSGYVKGSKFEHRRTKCTVSGDSQKLIILEKEYNSIK